MRRLTRFACGGDTLVATLDGEDGAIGVLIVAGGRQTRIGPHRLFERLGHALTAEGVPCFRFDRRGVGDSDGDDRGFEGATPDIIAAAAAFRALCPSLGTLVAVGLCDGATGAALAAEAAGIDGLVLLNPWVVEPQAGLPPRAAIAATYRSRLTSFAAWKRLLSGAIDWRKAWRGLTALAGKAEDHSLFERFAAALADRPATILLADRDATAQAFAALWRGAPPRRIATASHSFAAPEEFAAVLAAVRAALGGYSAA